MSQKYKKFDHLFLPENLKRVLEKFENSGMLSPVLFGGAIRDSVTGYKPINDLDIRFAGLKDPATQDVLKALLEISSDNEVVHTPPPDGIKEHFHNALGVNIVSCALKAGKINLKGIFLNATKDSPSLDFSFSKTSCMASSKTITNEVLKKANASMSCVASGTDGQIYGHKNFETDALEKRFIANRGVRHFSVAPRDYCERLQKTIPDLVYVENPASLTHAFLKSNTPTFFALLKQLQDYTTRTRPQKPKNPAQEAPETTPLIPPTHPHTKL